MPLSDPWLPAPWTPGWQGILFDVYRLPKPTESEPDPEPELLPALEYLGSATREGADPGTCLLRYNLDRPAYDTDAPRTFEEALSTSSTGGQVVEAGDRIAVKGTRAGDDAEEWIFDGIALDFRLELADGVEEVEILCVGIGHRLDSIPILGQYQRHADGDGPDDDVQTDLVVRANPKGVPNCSGDDDPAVNAAGQEYPVFVEPEFYRDFWTLPRYIKYLLYHHNAEEEYVHNQGELELDALLVSREPLEGETFDPADPDTYTAKPITAPDDPLTGKGLLATVKELVGAFGFGVKFLLEDDGGAPKNTLLIFHPQVAEPKDLWLQPRGTTLDGTLTNLAACSLGRDLREIATVVEVQGALERWEVSVILKPGFPSDPADAADADSLAKFVRGHTDFESNRLKYRDYVLSEAPPDLQGWYEPGEDTLHDEPTSLDGLFGGVSMEDPTPKYVKRKRPAIGELITRDASGVPLKYQVHISRDYTGPIGLWDGTGTWKPVSGLELLKDRCGVRIPDSVDPNNWNIGGNPKEVVKGVEDQALSGSTHFTVRLTAVLESDKTVKGTASRRDTAPLDYDVTRIVDRRDQLKYEAISPKSQFNDTTEIVVQRDDDEQALALARAIQQTLDSGALEGSVTIDYFTTSYPIGTRIASINGRNLGLRTDGGDETTTPVLPVVVSVSHSNRGEQRTTLQLSDAAVSRRTYQRRGRRR